MNQHYESSRSGSLAVQLMRRVGLLGIIAVLGIGLTVITGTITGLMISQQRLNEASAEAARTFDLSLSAIEYDLRSVGDALHYVENIGPLLVDTLERRGAIYQLTLVNPDGTVRLARQKAHVVPVDRLAQPWLETVTTGATYISPLEYVSLGGQSTSRIPMIDLAVPVYDENREFAGTLVAKLDLTALWDEVRAIRVGENGYGYLVSATGDLLAYSNMQLVIQGTNIQDVTGYLPDDISRGTLIILSLYHGMGDKMVVASAVPLQHAPWYAVVEQPWFEALEGFIPVVGGLLVVMLAALLLMLNVRRYTRRSVIQPLQQVGEGLRIFGAGDLDYRITPQGSREIRELGIALNEMAADLKQSRAAVEEANRTLEQRVAEQTRNLALVSRVSNAAVAVLDVQELLQLVADLTKETFDLYHAHIYILDKTGQRLVLAAGAGEIGRTMAASGHSIALNREHSLVARAARERGVVAVDDVRTTPDFLPNPLLPNTLSELAVALVARGQLLGVLDVQSDQIGRFDLELRNVMSTLAEQVAVAVHNAQLYSEADRTSRHERALSLITSQIQSATTIEDVLQAAARELGKALRVPQTAIELSLPDEMYTGEKELTSS